VVAAALFFEVVNLGLDRGGEGILQQFSALVQGPSLAGIDDVTRRGLEAESMHLGHESDGLLVGEAFGFGVVRDWSEWAPLPPGVNRGMTQTNAAEPQPKRLSKYGDLPSE
jgi:hypothetical protein